eukprot:938023-Amphidinium_carterae.1
MVAGLGQSGVLVSEASEGSDSDDDNESFYSCCDEVLVALAAAGPTLQRANEVQACKSPTPHRRTSVESFCQLRSLRATLFVLSLFRVPDLCASLPDPPNK